MSLEPRGYKCGHCNRSVGPNLGYLAQNPQNPHTPAQTYIYVCSYCSKPTFFEPSGRQFPGVGFGDEVASLPPDVASLYSEARSSIAANAFTASVLTCRKLLMHLAVEKGAPEGKSFLEYVEYLAQKGYVPPNGKGWVDHIRTKGNEANHEIKIMDEAAAKDLITFTEMLLKFDYEFPAKVTAPAAAAAPAKP